MTTCNQTDSSTAEVVPDSFEALYRRFLSLSFRFDALKDTLGRSDNMGSDDVLAAGAYVFYETTGELAQLRQDIESWHAAHEHTPKAPRDPTDAMPWNKGD